MENKSSSCKNHVYERISNEILQINRTPTVNVNKYLLQRYLTTVETQNTEVIKKEDKTANMTQKEF